MNADLSCRGRLLSIPALHFLRVNLLCHACYARIGMCPSLCQYFNMPRKNLSGCVELLLSVSVIDQCLRFRFLKDSLIFWTLVICFRVRRTHLVVVETG